MNEKERLQLDIYLLCIFIIAIFQRLKSIIIIHYTLREVVFFQDVGYQNTLLISWELLHGGYNECVNESDCFMVVFCQFSWIQEQKPTPGNNEWFNDSFITFNMKKK